MVLIDPFMKEFACIIIIFFSLLLGGPLVSILIQYSESSVKLQTYICKEWCYATWKCAEFVNV